MGFFSGVCTSDVRGAGVVEAESGLDGVAFRLDGERLDGRSVFRMCLDVCRVTCRVSCQSVCARAYFM